MVDAQEMEMGSFGDSILFRGILAMSFDPEKVARWRWMENEDGDFYMERWSQGDWVKHEDYKKLLTLLHDVSSEADPAGTLRELRLAQDTIRAQEKLIEELKAEIERLKG